MIREAVEMDEMAFAGKLPTRQIKSDIPDDETSAKTKRTLERYYSGEHYVRRADVLLKPLGIDVWIAPVIDVNAEIADLVNDGRIERMDPKKGVEWLVKNAGYERSEVEGKARPGSALVVAMSGGATKSLTNSVWGLLHSLFDNRQDSVTKIAGDTADQIADVMFGDTDYETLRFGDEEVQDAIRAWTPYMPFKWVRYYKPTAVDMISELLVAATFRPTGLVFKRPEGGEVSPQDLEKVEKLANEARGDILRGIREFLENKVTLIQVSPGLREFDA